PIIRFDAAMTLAKKHIRRLWYPRPGKGGDIAGRAPHSLDDATFHRLIPNEFWREVVDRINEELPDTLLLAEAFWMMEGYFVRTLGMHRVYNSAFMNMLKNQENRKYRETIKNTLAYEPEILKRFVNFMNNPDEETAIAQFGDGDKYFGVCTLLATMPGLPMFGHGQVEGFREKYGMEYRRAYWDETANRHLVDEHYRRIFPLLKRRHLFSDVEHFELFDLVNDGYVHESAFCYVNGTDTERSLVLYNNQYEMVEGRIKHSAPKLVKNDGGKHTATTSLAESLGLTLSGRRFVIWDSFTDKLTYMTPSLKLFDDGLRVHLWGFETKVILNIREVEDTDGVYAELYERIGDRGIANFEEEIMALRLRPIIEAMENLRSESFFALLSSIFDRTGSSKEERTLLLALGEAYARLTTAYELLHPQTKKVLDHPPRDPDVKAIMENVKRLDTLFSDPEARLFSQSRILLDELGVVVSSAFFLNPFMREETGITEAILLSERLQLCRFYAKKLEEAGFVGDDRIKACQSGAIVVGAHRAYRKGDRPQETLARLLEEERVRTYALVNEYQGVVWFDKERMQELIVLSALSIAMNEPEFEPTAYVKTLFDAQRNASYRLKSLLALPE
ncbi:MAG: alpha-amylase, partial [Spirochaetales bacterium]|nr:alpha-amylase [Spirochaetales bacterium]